MKKFTKLAFAAAAVAMAASAYAQSVPYEKKAVNDNWGNGTSEWVWKNGTNELCWRNGFWTPATANVQCDGALAPAAAPAQTPAAKPPVTVGTEKVTFAADALFDFDKAVLKPEGKAKLDDLVSKLKNITLEVVIAVGHTDSFGSDKYNDRLSVRRAEAVKGYLVSKGIEANRVYTEGKGKRQLKVDPKSCKGARKAQIACQQPNRRVEVEVVGTRSAQ
ncbi:OmpA family protein [Ralstonia solanacearum]|uniref:OmpA-like domain-containing protein n=1 Tax=Ralstonia solanacearum K60 TaxID=1091042 RepID=A0AAP7ZLQ4_RALSL|nr:OmpA family protein [Ralstonia solanacearum]AYB52131.2 OmpA family protein [Ralstonia solanacearum]AYB56690.1 OmpA family protein [Ralstonia solanacearum]MBB6591710.1 OmpA family protein [Ralstonia solanacearum]MBB6595933.1 OmpA family protein [Ralstonia solanacearum]MBT1537538.1 OmpA family protein [Ralstonia solanacearum]